jgi:hypothetical protein
VGAAGLDVDGAGRIAVSGDFSDRLRLNPGSPGSLEMTVSDDAAFVFVLSPDGQVEWVRIVYDGALGSEDVVSVSFGEDGTLWASGTFDASTATVSYGEPDAIVIANGDDDPNDNDDFLAHFDANGGLLGVATATGDGPQYAESVVPRPGGGVDWLVLATGTTLTDMVGGVSTVPGEGDQVILRLDASGVLQDVLAFPDGVGAQHIGYRGADLVALVEGAVPATMPAWDGTPGVELVQSPANPAPVFHGLVTWAGGIAPVTAEMVDWSGLFGGLSTSEHGQSVALHITGDTDLLPESLVIEIPESNFTEDSMRPSAVVWNADGSLVCGVDIESRGTPWSNTAIVVSAIDEAGGVWMAGEFREAVFTAETYQGGPAGAVLDATLGEDDQGFLARWQLWPAPALP